MRGMRPKTVNESILKIVQAVSSRTGMPVSDASLPFEEVLFVLFFF